MRKPFYIVVALIVICFTATRLKKSSQFESLEVNDRSVILYGNKSLILFDQCSRPGPSGVEALWSPTARDIEILENKLPGFLANQKSRIGEPLQADLTKFVRYYKQYGGFMRRGRRMIYINANAQADVNWLQKAIVICDGGESSYGAEYDVESGRMNFFRFNGTI